MLRIDSTADEIQFTVFVQPRASANKVAGRHGNALKIRLTAPPVDNAANRMCLKFLSRLLKIPASSMEITSGSASRTKTIRIRCPEGKDAGEIAKSLKALAEKT